MTLSKQKRLDRAGMWITTLCAIHCLLLPLILPMLALAGFAFIGEDALENTILGLSVLVGLWSLVGGARRHGQWLLLLPLLAGAFIYSQRDIFGHIGEPFIILLGAGLIIYAHWSNLKRSRRITLSTPVAVPDIN